MPEDHNARVRAPEFDGAAEWFNVAAPLSLKALRGKVVLLDFWTYGCVNCMHLIPDLKYLEDKYGDALVVIGVHSAKFTNERNPDNLRRIIVRYEITHPVVNDAAFKIWREYGARAWPTQVLIDPEGYVVGAASGEGHRDQFDRAIAAVLHVFDEQGKIDRTPLPLAPERERIASSTLAFPGKVLADAASGRLFIADSNHNRIAIASEHGGVWSIDETVGDVGFFRPQGMALDAGVLYVADTENHMVRAVDLQTKQVTRIAGTGTIAAWNGDGGAAKDTPLNSPWDLALRGRLLFVAMAGPHQIWVIDLDRGLAMPYAGSGREARVDGPADEAAFAQPSGLAIHGDVMYVADAESNIIRRIFLPPKNEVRTLAGGDLFDFGDVDGLAINARFQHPLGIAWADGRLLVADTYNHKIRTVDPVSGDAGTLASGFAEPGGLSVAGDWAYVADTNAHAVRRVHVRTGAVETVI